MSEENTRPIDLIDVVPRAGATLNRGATWKDVIEVPDSVEGLADFVSVVTDDEMQAFLREEHHAAYGRPWALGRIYESYLVGRGVGQGDRVLDFGCGAGRVGHRLIERLGVGAYVGLDSHLLSLKAFAAYEIPLHELEPREPVLIWGGVESLGFFQPDFSVVLDLFATLHLPQEQRLAFFGHVARLLRPGGRLISCATGSDVAQDALASGFRISHKEVQNAPLLWPLRRKKQVNSWIEYVVKDT